LLYLGLTWAEHRRSRDHPFRDVGVDFCQRDVPRQHDDRNTSFCDRDPDGPLEDLWKLICA
jgi:hypothetical protein